MRKIILKTALLFASFITFAQNSESNCNYNDSIFKLLPKEMTFDVEKYKVETMSGYDKILIDNENYKSYFRKSTESIYYNQTNKNYNLDKTIYYYFNGKIESINFYFQPYEESGSANIGTSTSFNLDGSIKETYNYDKGYKICYNVVIPIVKKIIGEKKIKKYELKFSIGRTDLNNLAEAKAKWIVSVTGNKEFHKKIKPSNSHDYIIDGVTGKLIGILKPTYALD